MPAKNVVVQRTRKDLWLLRIVALLISLLLWITVYGGKPGELTRRVGLDYQVPKGMVIANPVPRELTVRVSGPRAFLREYQDRVVTLPIDLSTHKEGGEFEVLLNEEMFDVPLGLKVLSLSPSVINVQLEHLAIKKVPVRLLFSGQLPDGWRLEKMQLQPSTVEVRGPQERLRQIEEVQTEPFSLEGLAATHKRQGQIPLNLSNLRGVTVSDADKTVRVNLEISKVGGAKRSHGESAP